MELSRLGRRVGQLESVLAAHGPHAGSAPVSNDAVGRRLGEGAYTCEPGVLPLREIERRHLENTLVHCSGNLSEAARLLGIGRTTLYRKIAKYGLSGLSRD
jgi:transcriptional regulator of acetoin/glycerol metabolism